MAFVGNFSAVSPGDLKSFSIDVSAQLGTGETIASMSSLIGVVTGVDPNAAAPSGSPTKTGAVVSQWIGTAFLPAVVYRWTLTVTTNNGSVLVNHAHVPCVAIN